MILYTTLFKNASIFLHFFNVISYFFYRLRDRSRNLRPCTLPAWIFECTKSVCSGKADNKIFLLHRSSIFFFSSTFSVPQSDSILLYAERWIWCVFLPAHGDQFIDRISSLRKLFFILSHDIPFIHFFIMMKIISKCLHSPLRLFDLLQRKVKK